MVVLVHLHRSWRLSLALPFVRDTEQRVDSIRIAKLLCIVQDLVVGGVYSNALWMSRRTIARLQLKACKIKL